MGKEKIGKVMHEWKAGTLNSSSGQKVTNQKQAVAIALSEAGMSKTSKALAAMKRARAKK